MESTLRPTIGLMAVSMLTAIIVFGACKTTPKPKPPTIARGLLAQTWAMPTKRTTHLALVDDHIFATDMNTIHALHRQGGVWFSAQIDRDERNQNTWLTATKGAFALLHGRQSLALYDMRKRQVIYRLPCPTSPCGRAKIISTTPMVIQIHDKAPTSTATSWHILQDQPWQVAWHWGMQTSEAPQAQVIHQKLVIFAQKTIHTLDLKSGKTLSKHNIPWPTTPTDDFKWAVHNHRGLFVSTSTPNTSQLVLMNLEDGRVLKSTTTNHTPQRLMATSRGWLIGGHHSVALWSWDLKKPHWHSKPVWATWRWSGVQANANHIIGRREHDKTIWVIDLKSGRVGWKIETQSAAQPLAIDGQSNVITSIKDGVLGLWRAPLHK